MPPRIQIVLIYALMCAIWGTTWLAIKIGLRTTPPITGVGIRFFIAGSFLYLAALPQRRFLPWKQLPIKLILVLAATLFGLNYVLTYVSETHLASGLVAVLFGTLPFFTFGFGHFMIGERTSWVTWAGAALAFCGVGVISVASLAQGSLWYVLAAIGAAAGSAWANVYYKRHSEHDALVVLPPAMLLAGFVLGIAGIVLEHPTARAFSASAIPALLYLAIAGSGVAFFLNMWLLKRIDVWIVALSALIIPVLAVFVGIILGGEVFDIHDIAGAALVIAGVSIALTSAKAAEAVRSEPAL